jgi:hypothetical protein
MIAPNNENRLEGMINPEPMNGDYVVFLPEKMDIEGYHSVPKIGKTTAGSERKAVSNILFRSDISNDLARIILSKLDKKKFGGVEKYAALIPELEVVGGKKTGLYKDYALAMELAEKNNSENVRKYIPKARFLLRAIGDAPTMQGYH